MLTEFAGGLVATGGIEGVVLLTFALFIGHALGDYPLQGAFLAASKNRNSDSDISFGNSEVPKGLWIHALSAHSLIQGGIVWMITGSALLGMVEFVIHWLTDFVRCENWISFTSDQLIHLACKVAFAITLCVGVAMPF